MARVVLGCWCNIYVTYMLGYGFVTNYSNPLYISDDMLCNFLGWHLYRYDEWYWPLTVTHRLQYPLYTSIVYTDSFPILAILLKFISPFLPTVFIWHSVVAIINCGLQFYFASLILRRLRSDNYLAIIGGVFFVFSSALAFRLFKHYTLTSHWLILWSLALIFKTRVTQNELKQNLLILVLASGTHAYLLMMNLILSFALWYKLVCRTENNKYNLLCLEIFKTILVTGISLYVFGYFVLDNSAYANTGWGDFSFNLNSWFNSLGYSSFIPELPVAGDQAQESCQYLGLGIITALVVAVIHFSIYSSSKLKFKNLMRSEYLGLWLIIVVLIMMSLSTRITFNSRVLIDVTNYFTADFLIKFFGMIRASARFAWPVFYLLMLGAIVGCYDFLSKFNKKTSLMIMMILLLIQIADLFKLRQDLHAMINNNLSRPDWDADLQDSRWQTLGYYKHLIDLFPHQKVVDGTYESYYKFGWLAAKYGLTMNLFYLARGYNTEYSQQVMNFTHGNWSNDKVYIVSSQLLQLSDPRIWQYCRRLDNYNVCTRNW